MRLTIGDRGLKEGKIELKRRNKAEAEMVGMDQIVAAVRRGTGIEESCLTSLVRKTSLLELNYAPNPVSGVDQGGRG